MVVAGEQKALQIRLRHEHYRGEYQIGKAFTEESYRLGAGVGGFLGNTWGAAPVP